MAEIVEKCPDLPQCYHEEDVIELHPTENISEELIISNSNLDESTETKQDSGIEGMFLFNNSYKIFTSENNSLTRLKIHISIRGYFKLSFVTLVISK